MIPRMIIRLHYFYPYHGQRWLHMKETYCTTSVSAPTHLTRKTDEAKAFKAHHSRKVSKASRISDNVFVLSASYKQWIVYWKDITKGG